MSRFDDFHNDVREFMRDFGFLATYVHTVSSTPNDATGEVDDVTESIEIEAIKMELVRPVEGSGSKSGTLIQDGDQMLYVRPTEQVDKLAQALSVNPSADHIVINNKPWRIVTWKEYNPSASECIMYEFYIRK